MTLTQYAIIALAALSSFSAIAKDYYVSPQGKASNKGSKSAPFLSIQQAIDEMKSGDTCYIRARIYRDSVSIDKDDITLQAYQDEYVVLYGTKPVVGWQHYQGKIYRAKVGKLEPQFTQLMFKYRSQPMARYPDQSTGDMFRIDRESGYAALTTLPHGGIRFDAPLSGKENDWKGGYFRACAAKRGGTNPQGRIISNKGNEAQCEELNTIWESSSNTKNKQYLTCGMGDGYIFHLKALSRAGEWWYEDGYVYFWQEDGQKPTDGSVEVQDREYVLSAKGVKHLKLKGIHTRFGNIELVDCQDSSIEDGEFRELKGWFFRKSYGHSMRDIGGIYLKGKNLSIKNCYFTKSWGNLLNLDHCEGVSISNCVFEDNGWMGMFTSCILSNSDQVSITRCSFGSTGRFHIRSDGHARLDVSYCDFTDATKMCQDAGSIELTNTSVMPAALDMKGSTFAYNSFHDMSTTKTYAKNNTQFACALYFEGAQNYTVHHNLFYNISNEYKDGTFLYLGPRTASIKDIYFYNNTVWNIDKRIKIWYLNQDGHAGKISNMHVVNNIFSSGMIDSFGEPVRLESGISFKNNVTIPLSKAHQSFTDTRRDNFTLLRQSSAVDAGCIIPKITDGFKGKAPDVGCFEGGNKAWTSGATLKIREYYPDEEGEL